MTRGWLRRQFAAAARDVAALPRWLRKEPMAYFSNGTEGEMYRQQYCERCVHLPERDDSDCPIWSAHFFHNFEQCKSAVVADILSLLIPRSEDKLSNERCAFFQDKQFGSNRYRKST